ncbi:MAG: glutamate--tRNA ligase [Acidimicrobiia bacterium]
MSSKPVLRMAPSPTGQLHVGTARTALFNFLYARHLGATFRMRIEDTDVTRSKREHADAFCEMLNWMGIDWDDEIVYQSDRFDKYSEAINDLLGKGLAYECFETVEELEQINEERKAKKLPPGYDGRARNLSTQQIEEYKQQGRPRTVRFITPDSGTSEFEDAIRGTVSVQWENVSDFVIERADRTPTFFLANAVDDIDMGITHVVRGEDLIDSTHRVLALRKALGSQEQPFYAHTPMILAPDRSKLSKRHGAVSLESYKQAGYLPEAVVNYLVLLGWSPQDGREIVSLEEMISEFDIHNVNHSGAIFDIKKLEWMNGEYIRSISKDDLVTRIKQDVDNLYPDADPKVVDRAVELAQPRATTVNAIIDQMDCLFNRDFSLSEESVEKLKADENSINILTHVKNYLETCQWNIESIDLRELVNSLDLKPRKALPLVYLAIENSNTGLPLFDVIYLIGREKSLDRISKAISSI